MNTPLISVSLQKDILDREKNNNFCQCKYSSETDRS